MKIINKVKHFAFCCLKFIFVHKHGNILSNIKSMNIGWIGIVSNYCISNNNDNNDSFCATKVVEK